VEAVVFRLGAGFGFYFVRYFRVGNGLNRLPLDPAYSTTPLTAFGSNVNSRLVGLQETRFCQTDRNVQVRVLMNPFHIGRTLGLNLCCWTSIL
jgi:hypothetical protein